MLKRVKVQGYKSLTNIDIELQSLSVLFGPNAAGKSNFLETLSVSDRILRGDFDALTPTENQPSIL
ncbi:MAG: hypothetical protein Fur0025_12550 [Oscillatoriaceae cyanobacterium]